MTEKKFEVQGDSNSPYSKWLTAEQYEDYKAEIEKEKEVQFERELDSCADDIEMFDEDPKDLFDYMNKKYGISDDEFIHAMKEREIYLAEWQINPEVFEYQKEDTHSIPVAWIMERLYKYETGQEFIDGDRRKFLKEIVEEWNEVVKENLENE